MRTPYLLAASLAILALPIAAVAAGGTAEREAVLAGYAAKARVAEPGFAGFSPARGETLFRTSWMGGDARTPTCMSCHTSDPRQLGRNAKTGRPIDPVAVSANPKRYTDAAEVDRQFTRDCKSVLGRDCTPVERGDYIAFMAGR